MLFKQKLYFQAIPQIKYKCRQAIAILLLFFVRSYDFGVRPNNVNLHQRGDLILSQADQASLKSAYSVNPPSINSVCPVIYVASSDAKKATAAAISSEVPARPIGI